MSVSSTTPITGENGGLEVLWENGERVFCRSWHHDTDGRQVARLAVLAAGDQRMPDSVDRLVHEFGLRNHLNGAWALRPLELVRDSGRSILILEWPGGEPLNGLVGSPMDVGQFLRIANGLSATLRGLHEGGLIHKDIKPSNVFVDATTGKAWLTGFGIALRLPRERQSAEPPQFIAGTLSYMAPEQTGRMNRSIDSRSDLYALGVTLYQLLTGSLPFAATDPMNWVHCHVARKPVPPSERLANVPAAISAIVMKLLAKAAEERYQTAAGLERDLQHCLAEWEDRALVQRFPLARHDTPDRLVIPERLYGREDEVAALNAAFSRCSTGGKAEFILVSGYSGVGKSSVVNELHKALVPGGLFATGKFDEHKRDIPYAILAQAFQSLISLLLSKSIAELEGWRAALLEALGENGQLMIEIVPELRLIIGDQPPALDLPPQQAQRRLQLVFRSFVGVFAAAAHPLALFLDDLQWLDAATLDLIEDLLIRSDLHHLLLIGAYRDNEVDATHPLARKLTSIKSAGVTVEYITLAPLRREHVEQFIAAALYCEPERAIPLTQLVHEKTAGNPFFVIQFLSALVDEGLVAFDRQSQAWSWDLGKIRTKAYTDNVADLVADRLSQLSLQTLSALQQLACLGDGAEAPMLSAVLSAPEEQIRTTLWEAVRQDLIEHSNGSYRFRHDRVREAAYASLSEEERAAAHSRIGRLLLAHTPLAKREEKVFEIVSHFNRSAALLESSEEREELAHLNLLAGKRAKNTAAYASALTYFADGRALLAEDCWTRQYPLTFDFELCRAECEFMTGELPSADARLSVLAGRAADLVDQAAVTCLLLDLYIVFARPERAIGDGLKFLLKVGIDLSQHPTDQEVREAYEQIWQRLGTRRIEDLIDLPLMEDRNRRATLDVLNKLEGSVLYQNPKLHQLANAHMVIFSMEHGNSAASCVGYASLGQILAAEFADHSTALRFGQLSLDLIEKRRLDAFGARVNLIFGAGISSGAQHLRLGLPFLRRALAEATKYGDLPHIGYCHSNIVANLISSGELLLDVDRSAMEGLHFAHKTGSRNVAAFILGQLRLIRALRGLPCDFASFDGEEFDADNFELSLGAGSHMALAANLYWSRRMQALVFEGHYSAALEAAARPQELFRTPLPNIEGGEYHFYAALARAGSVRAVDSARTEQEVAHLDALRVHLRQLQVLVENCPENFAGRAALVGAELARLEGHQLEADQLYAKAIQASRANGFIHVEALAYETAARSYAARGFDDIAEMHLLRARDGYRCWGADGKVRQLEARHPVLAILGARGESRATPSLDQQFDAAAVVKASQALSGEVLLPRLIERLMRIAVEHAGAERGVLVLVREGVPRIAAAAATGQSEVEVEVAVRQEPVVSSDLPLSMMHYVNRTQECVLLNDAAADNEYSNDVYFVRKISRSVLCMPIVKQKKLVGVLYLENNLAPFVFTRGRVAMLQWLASQAAISLENADLYADLQLQVGLLHRIPVSAWTLEPDGTPDFVNQVWLDFAGQTRDFVRSYPEAWMAAIHAEDREMAAKTFWEGVHSGQDFAIVTRSLRARDGTYRWHLQQAAVLRDSAGKVLKFVGTTTDVDEQKRAEEALRQAQGDLARINRVTTMGELVASMAHEISQPISGAAINAGLCLRILSHDNPDLDEMRVAATRMLRDAQRASAIVKRIRSRFEQGAPDRELVDINEVIQETVGLLRGEASRYKISVRTELAADLLQTIGDRVQLQQVAMNLIVNSIEAMKDVDGKREIIIRSQQGANEQILVSFCDTGPGFRPQLAEQMFEPFYTTKPHGTGMGLRISRSIIDSHHGRLWAESATGRGATFHLNLPAAISNQ
jgi:PAS domain S-box-containing protein